MLTSASAAFESWQEGAHQRWWDQQWLPSGQVMLESSMSLDWTDTVQGTTSTRRKNTLRLWKTQIKPKWKIKKKLKVIISTQWHRHSLKQAPHRMATFASESSTVKYTWQPQFTLFSWSLPSQDMNLNQMDVRTHTHTHARTHTPHTDTQTRTDAP